MMNSSKTKRIGSWLLALVLLVSLFSVFGVSALADETPSATVSLENVRTNTDGTISADLMVTGNGDTAISFVGAYIKVPDGLTLSQQDPTANAALGNAILTYDAKAGFVSVATFNKEYVLDENEEYVLDDKDDAVVKMLPLRNASLITTLTFKVKKQTETNTNYGDQMIGVINKSETVENEKTRVMYLTGEYGQGDADFEVTLGQDIPAYQFDSRLTLNANYEGASDSAEIKAKTGATIAPTTPTRTGYDFTGWYTSADCAATDKVAAATTMPDGDTTWYAGWEKQTYTITLNADNGSATPTSITVKYGEKYPELPTPTKENYNFAGWYCGDKMVKEGDALAKNENHTLTAHWVEKGVITLDTTTQTFTYGDEGIAFAVKAAGTSEIPAANTFKVEYYVDGKWITTAPANAGSCDVKITREKDEKWKAYSEVITGGLVIDKKSVTAPAADTTTFTYTGSERTYNVTKNDAMYTVTGDKKTDAGDYKVTVELTDKDNYKWSTTGNSNDLSYDFNIAKATVAEPAGDTTTFTYDGQKKTYTVKASELYEVKDNEQTDAGTYSVKIALKDTKNYKWTKADNSDDLSYSFVIAQAEQTAPTGITATGETFFGKADGELNGLTTAMEYSHDGNTWTKATSTSAENLAAGEYQIRFAETKNYKASPAAKVAVTAGRKLVVSFNAAGGTIATADTKQEVEWQGTVTAPKVTKTGFDLVGWYKDGKLWDLAKDKVEADMTLDASWKYALKATGSEFTVGSASNGLTISVAHGIKLTKANLKAVYVGQNVLDAANYTVDDTNGNLTVTLTKDYLNTLTTGNYDIQITLQNSDDVTLDRAAMENLIVKLTVEEKPADTATPAPTATATAKKTPVKTGDSSNALLWCVLVIGCGAAVTGVVLWDKKRRNN